LFLAQCNLRVPDSLVPSPINIISDQAPSSLDLIFHVLRCFECSFQLGFVEFLEFSRSFAPDVAISGQDDCECKKQDARPTLAHVTPQQRTKADARDSIT